MPIADGRRHEGRLWKRGVSIAAYLRTTDYRRSTPDLDPGHKIRARPRDASAPKSANAMWKT